MPVSNISVVGVRSSTVGADRWIGQRSLTSIGSPWSMTSPSRLKMRPSVTSPTGTVIGPPVSTTSMPRARPSVESIATARTRSSPRCCWTSHTRVVTLAPPVSSESSSPVASCSTMIAELISGSSSGKTASITTPWISSIRPTLRLPSPCWVCCASVWFSVLASMNSPFALRRRRERRRPGDVTVWLDQRLGAGDDFHDLLGDLRLALAVHLQGQVLDQVARVLGGVAHRGHARAVLGGRGLEQRPEDRDLDVGGHEPLEDLLRIGLVLHQRVVVARLVLVALAGAARQPIVVGVLEDRRLLQRQQRLLRHLLRERRDVAVVEDLDAVGLAVDVGRHELLGDPARVGVGWAVGEADIAPDRLLPAEVQRRDAAAP